MIKKESEAAAARRARRDPLLVAIGDRIRKLREEVGISQRDMGERAGLTQGYIYMTENGSANVTAITLAKMAKVLGVPVSVLFMDSDDENNYIELLAMTGKRWQKLSDMLREEIERNKRVLESSIRTLEIVEEWIEEHHALTQDPLVRIDEKK